MLSFSLVQLWVKCCWNQWSLYGIKWQVRRALASWTAKGFFAGATCSKNIPWLVVAE